MINHIVGQDGAMWVRGRDAVIEFAASDPADTITFEIQDAYGSVVHTITSTARAAGGLFVYPVSYQESYLIFVRCLTRA
jgi:hypothetical protein